MENIFVEFLPPWIETGIQPAFYDKESGSVLQQTARMYARVNMLIRMFNKLSKQTKQTVEEYIDKFNELYQYVHDYFDNLDVQEEINNKLDQMVEDGTLQEIIGEYLTPMIKILFCKQKGEVQSGDATLIKAFDKNVLIDTHLASLKSNIEAFLTRNEATHLDYVILTHYHPDHVGNVKNLCDDGYIDSDTTVYLPGYTHLIADNVSLTNAYLEVTGSLTTAGATVIQPTESTTLTIEDATFKFYNCTQQIFDTEEQYTSYNDCSTVVELDYGDRKALFSGDIEVKPFKRFERLNCFPYKIDLYTVEHHGINYDGSVLPFISRITPDYAVQSAELGDFVGGSIGQGATTIFLKNKNCKLYSTYNNSNDIIFEMRKYDVICKQGIENYSTSNRRPNIPIYVDINTVSSNRDGSEAQPFKDLQEALSRIAQNEHTAFTIHLADGTYEANSNSAVLGKISGSTQITIDGNHDHPENTVIANSCQIYNGAYVKYQYVKFTKQVAYVENSLLEIDHCIGLRSEANSEPYIYGGGGSEIRVINSTFTGNGNGQLISGHGDDIYARSNTFDTFNICFQNQNSGSTITLENTYTNVTSKKYLFNGALDKSQPQVFGTILWNGNATGTPPEDLTLTDAVDKYNELHLYIGYQGNSTTVVINDINQSNIRVGSTTYHYAFFMRRSAGNTVIEYIKICFPDKNTLRILERSTNDTTLRTVYGVKLPTAINE